MEKPKIQLSGMDGNAFMIMGRVKSSMIAFGRDNENYDVEVEYEKYLNEAKSGDYDHVIQTTMEFCDVS